MQSIYCSYHRRWSSQSTVCMLCGGMSTVRPTGDYSAVIRACTLHVMASVKCSVTVYNTATGETLHVDMKTAILHHYEISVSSIRAAKESLLSTEYVFWSVYTNMLQVFYEVNPCSSLPPINNICVDHLYVRPR